MELLHKSVTGCLVFNTKVFEDSRGYFFESFQLDAFTEVSKKAYGSDFNCKFVQSNVSFSKAGVLRGMHYQVVTPQAKFVRVLSGEILDMVVDVREGSSTYGEVEVFELNECGKAVFIPEGFAHGFLAKKPTILQYMVSDYYSPSNDRSIYPLDDKFPWPKGLGFDFIVSDKDLNGAKWGSHDVDTGK